MPARRRLSDLYVTGKEVTIDDGHGAVTVWLQKCNPVENGDALRHGAARRASAMTYAKNRDSMDWHSATRDVQDFMSRDALLDLAIREELHKRRVRIEGEHAADEEWAKDDYIKGLVDAWEGTSGDEEEGSHAEVQLALKDRFALDENDLEAKHVHDELDRFDLEVEALVDAERASLIADWEGAPDEELVDKAVERVLEQRASQAFSDEYETWTLYWATREPTNHAEKYFKTSDEIHTLSEKVREDLVAHYQTLLVEPSEGKGSEEIPGSSLSSEQPAQAETGDSSGLVVAGA